MNEDKLEVCACLCSPEKGKKIMPVLQAISSWNGGRKRYTKGAHVSSLVQPLQLAEVNQSLCEKQILLISLRRPQFVMTVYITQENNNFKMNNDFGRINVIYLQRVLELLAIQHIPN